MLKNQTVRFFINAYDENDDYDTWEVTEECFEKFHVKFKEFDCGIDYTRHTIRENGVNQICLTLYSDNVMLYKSELDILPDSLLI